MIIIANCHLHQIDQIDCYPTKNLFLEVDRPNQSLIIDFDQYHVAHTTDCQISVS